MSRPIHGGNLAWAAAVAGCSTADLLDFSASINPLGPPPSALNAIQTAISQLSAYPNPDYRQLREALCRANHLPSPDWVLPGNGAAELLTWAALELSKLEATYLVAPAFSDYRRALKTFGVRVVDLLLELPEALSVPSPVITKGREAIFDFRSPLEPLDSQSTKFSAILLNNPHNPTGTLMGREEILPYLDRFALVVIDEAFMDFLPPEAEQSLMPMVAEFENLVILRSLTKFYSLPGLRLGYAVAHPRRLDLWQQWRDPWPVNTLAAAAAEAVLEDRAFQRLTWDWLEIARHQLFTGLAELPGLQPYPGAANFLLVRCRVPVDELQITLLKRHRILIRDCLSFKELGDRFFRVAVRTKEQNQRLIDGLADVLGNC
ncbi:MAG: threonine-phosphate decarboxylase CobD [Cyanobacteriota bacterium]|nr:threonine-phosphate decarboxylase CobD [Cyanobacteriota bacterium]